MNKIIHFVHIAASSERVFWALTTLDGLAGWWSSDVSIQQPFGGVLEFRFVTDFNPAMEVVRAVQDDRVEWKCVGGHANWRDHTFLFEMRPDGQTTRLLFQQHCTFEFDPDVHGMYNFNWGHYLSSLKEFCETGEGRPFVRAG